MVRSLEPISHVPLLDGTALMRHPQAMFGDSLKVVWASGEVVQGELRFPAMFERISGWVILPADEMLAASSLAGDSVLIAFGGLIGWIADAAQNALARNALVKAGTRFELLIRNDDFSLSVLSHAIN